MHQSFSQRVTQPFASSAVKLLVKDDPSIKVPDGGTVDPVSRPGVVDDDVNEDETPPSDEENLPPNAEAGPCVPKCTPPLSRKSLLKSASKVVVTPVRRSIRQTPRTKVICRFRSNLPG